MRKNIVVIIVAVIAVVIVVATSASIFLNQQPEEEKVRDAGMSYIKTNHPDNATAMAYLSWQGGIRHNYEAGKITYIYILANTGLLHCSIPKIQPKPGLFSASTPKAPI